MRRAGAGSWPRWIFSVRSLKSCAAADGFDRYGLKHECLVAINKPELCFVRAFEGAFHFLQAGERRLLDLLHPCPRQRRAGERAGIDDQRRISPGITNMGANVQSNPVSRDALPGDFVDHGPRKFPRRTHQYLASLVAERLLDGLLADAANIGEAHAVRGQKRRQRMDQHAGHAERIGDEAGVLTASAAEAVERITGHVVAALHRYLLDRVRHILDGDLDKAVGDLFRRGIAAHIFRQGGKRLADCAGIERLVLRGSENLRKEIGKKLSDHDVGVCDRERTAAPVAFRPGIGAGGAGPDAKPRAVEVQDRATAGGDRVDQHHRGTHAHPGDLGFECALICAGKMRHVGRCAAHVKTDEPRKSGLPPGLGHADDAAGRT